MKLFFNRALKILLITNALIMVAAAMLGPIYALFVEEIGGNLLNASMAGGILAITGGITTLISGKYADKIKREEKIVGISYVLLAIGFILYTQVNSIYSLFAIQALIGFSGALYSPAFDKLYSKHITQKKAGREWGTWESMSYFTAAIGAPIGGLIVSNYGFNPLFVIMSSLCLISGIYILLLPKRIL